MPNIFKKPIAFFINLAAKIVGDKHPNSMRACDQLRQSNEATETLGFCDRVYCQSYSTALEKSRDCFLMGIPMLLYKRYGKEENDGMVSTESAKFGEYKGHCTDISLSHTQICGLFIRGDKKERIYTFYRDLCLDLESRGY